MQALHYSTLILCWLAIAPAFAQDAAPAQGMVIPGWHEPPAWFKESFLDMREDIAEATKSGRRLMLYFHQDGCPYCAKLLRENFGDKAIADKTRKHFDVIAINLWGDREVTDLAGKADHREGIREGTARAVHADPADARRKGRRGAAPERLHPAAPVPCRARLRRRPAGEAAELHRLPAGARAGAGERPAARCSRG